MSKRLGICRWTNAKQSPKTRKPNEKYHAVRGPHSACKTWPYFVLNHTMTPKGLSQSTLETGTVTNTSLTWTVHPEKEQTDIIMTKRRKEISRNMQPLSGLPLTLLAHTISGRNTKIDRSSRKILQAFCLDFLKSEPLCLRHDEEYEQ